LVEDEEELTAVFEGSDGVRIACWEEPNITSLQMILEDFTSRLASCKPDTAI